MTNPVAHSRVSTCVPRIALEQPQRRVDIGLGLILAALAIAITLLWFSFDYRLPTQDEAEHILNSIAASDLLEHGRPWQNHWWYQCLTISHFYPPFAYFINGFFLLALGQSTLAQHCYMAFYLGTLVAAVYAIARLLHGTGTTACISALCIAMYPAVSGLSHTYFLDLPETSMVALALATILWWRSYSQPNCGRTILTGMVIAAACLTKQLAVVYLAPAGLYFLGLDLKAVLEHKDGAVAGKKARLVDTVALGFLTLALGLPFIILNYGTTDEYFVSNLRALASKGQHYSFLSEITYWCQTIPPAISPILLAIFTAAIALARRKEYISLAPVAISAVGGLCLTCACPGVCHDYRYMVPVLIAPAIFSGFLLGKLLASSRTLLRITATIAITLASGNYLYCSFSPYPVPLPQLPWQSATAYYSNPVPLADWGYDDVLKTIKKVDRDHQVCLNILTNHDFLHIHAFELLLKERHIVNIMPTGPRNYTVVGDQVEPPHEGKAPFITWYLWKTGETGYTFYDQQSAHNFASLVDFVRESGKFELIMQKPLPDGTALMLYRQKSAKRTGAL